MFTSDINEQIKCLELKRNELETTLRQEQSPSLLKSLEEIKDSVLDLNELTPEILHIFIEKIEINRCRREYIIDSRRHLFIFKIFLATHSTASAVFGY